MKISVPSRMDSFLDVVVAYGEEADIRFTGIWIENDDSIPWTWWLTTGRRISGSLPR